MRRSVATVAVVCGVGLLVAPFALLLFDRAPAGERITNRFRETMSTRGCTIWRAISGRWARWSTSSSIRPRRSSRAICT